MGKLIVIEGLDGSGKATQAGLLEERLRAGGIDYRRLAFPDYKSDTSAPVRMYLNGELGGLDEVSAFGASILYTVDRYGSYMRDWRQDYEAGKLILCDRYTTSNVAHQMSKLPRGQWDDYLQWLEDLEYRRVGLPQPQRVVYLDMEPEVSRRLISERYNGDDSRRDIHESDFTYLMNCREAALYGAHRLGWWKLECSKNGEPLAVDVIAEMVMAAVEDVL